MLRIYLSRRYPLIEMPDTENNPTNAESGTPQSKLWKK